MKRPREDKNTLNYDIVVIGGGGSGLAAAVAAAILGTTLACLNTGVRVTYAISRDTEIPQPLGKLNPRFGTPAIGVWVLTTVSALIGAFGVLSLTNLTAVMLLSNFGTFLVYGITCLVAVLALSRERRSIMTKYVVPITGFAANIIMLIVVIWLGVAGGGATQEAAFIAIAVSAAWIAIGFGYYFANSRSTESGLFPFPGGKELDGCALPRKTHACFYRRGGLRACGHAPGARAAPPCAEARSGRLRPPTRRSAATVPRAAPATAAPPASVACWILVRLTARSPW